MQPVIDRSEKRSCVNVVRQGSRQPGELVYCDCNEVLLMSEPLSLPAL